MLGFKSILDQKQPVRILTTFLHKGITPHALLFTGIEGVGKRTVAVRFAMAGNCTGTIDANKQQAPGDRPQKTPCGRCRSCRKIASGSHPDVLFVAPSANLIRIAQIRSLCQTLSLKPYEAKIRVAIISGAESMNPEAANALLKMLEEPPEHTLLILTAIQRSDLLPTVVSRCQHIRFHPISKKSLETFLEEKHDIPHKEAVIIASMANGSLSRALSMIKPANREYWKNQRNWLAMMSGIVDPGSFSAKPVSSLLASAERLSKNNQTLRDSLEVMKTLLRDLVIWKFNPESIINKDLTQKIQYASHHMGIASLLSRIEAIEIAQKDIRANANTRLALEAMLMRFKNN